MATENTSTDVVVVRLEIQEGGSGGKTPEKAKKEVDALATSILGLQQANKKLREERNKLDTSTEEGRKKIKALNDIIDENTETIKKNSSALEQQRFNIGNYGSALDKLMPSVSNAIKGVQGMYKEFITFITTFSPWVIGLTAIVAVLTGLFKAYAKSAQGARDLEVAQGALQRTGQRLLNTFGALVENIIGEGGVTRALGGILTQINPLIGHYYELSVAVEKNIHAFERAKAAAEGAGKFYQELAELNKRIAEDDKKSAAERIAAAQRVIELLEAGADKRKEVLEARIKQLGRIENKSQETITEIANLRKELDDLGEETTGRVSPILQMIQSITDEYAKEQVERQKEQDEILIKQAEEARERRIAILEREIEREHYAYTQRLEFEETFHMNKEVKLQESLKRVNGYLAAQKKKEEADAKKAAERQIQIENYKNEAITGGINLVTKERTAARVFLNTLFKQDAIRETIINTKDAAMAAYKSLAGIPYVGPFLGAAAAAAVGIFGAAQVAGIVGVQFAQGGQVNKRGKFTGKSHAQGGEDYVNTRTGHRINVEADENFYVLKKSASREINYYSSINQKHGGNAWEAAGHYPSIKQYANGGLVVATQGQPNAGDIERTVRAVMQTLPPIYVVAQDVSNVLDTDNEIRTKAQVI